MLHKDFTGAPIRINDKVVALTSEKNKKMFLARVIRFTPKKVIIKVDGGIYEYSRMPCNLVVVPNRKE